MVRLGLLLTFALTAFGQVPEQPAYVVLETTETGDLRGTLTAALSSVPAGLPYALVRAMGCDGPAQVTQPYDSRIEVRCGAAHPSRLTFHAAIQLEKLTPLLQQAGIGGVQFVLTARHFGYVRVAPEISAEGRESGYYHAQYSLDEVPKQIVIDGGFESRDLLIVTGAALGLILSPFLILLLRPQDPLRLRVQMEGISVLGWLGWLWVLLRVQAGALLSYVCGPWTIGPLLVLLVPALIAVWIGSWLSSIVYERLAPNGVGADYYRRMRFWPGAMAACFGSTMLSVMLSTLNGFPWPLFAGLGLTVGCMLRIRRIGRGGSRPLTQGDLRARMFELAAKAGVTLRGVTILTSPTPRPPVALATRWGVVCLNQGVLTQLSRREVDAIVCHELSHLKPTKRRSMSGIYILLVAAIVGSQWVPHFSDFIPGLLLIVYFLYKAWRRGREWKADLDSVRWSGDPEAMISGLLRVSRAHGMPLEWGAPISWMMSHPATMDRVRAIAKAGMVGDARLAELIEESKRDAADHYVEAQEAMIPEDAAYSPALRQRLKTRLTGYLLLAPVMLGLPSAWLLERMHLPWFGVFSIGTVLSMLAMYFWSEWIVGSVRRRVKQRAITRYGQGVFAGFSPSAEPRLYDGSYQYDLGMVRFVDGAMEFAGDRARFTLDRSAVEKVWLGDGPPHWTPRKVVYIECRTATDAAPVVFSLQSMEAWCWPATVSTAKRLFKSVEDWRTAAAQASTVAQAGPVPLVAGDPDRSISVRTAFRSVSVYTAIAFCLASLGTWFDGSKAFVDPAALLCPVAVCGVLALFMVWPRLNFGRIEPAKACSTPSPR